MSERIASAGITALIFVAYLLGALVGHSMGVKDAHKEMSDEFTRGFQIGLRAARGDSTLFYRIKVVNAPANGPSVQFVYPDSEGVWR